MAGFDYGNARLRAMKSRLLSSLELEKLADAGNLQALIAELSKTSYREAVEAALARVSGLECIAAALHGDLDSTIKKIRSFYDGRAGEMVAVVLRAYDVRNLKAILRGLSKRARPDEILFTVLPVGELTDDILSELSRAVDPRDAIDMLATMALPFAHPLLRLRGDRPGAETPEMELILDQWYYEESFNYLQRKQQTEGILFSALQRDADITNLHTVIRFAYAPEERKFLNDWLGSDDITRLFVGPGKLSFDLLESAGKKETVDASVEILTGTAYGAPVRTGLEAYASTGRLSVFENQLDRFRLGWLSRLIGKDPLGIGLVLGFLALKTTEVSNIRWIAHGIFLGLPANSIRSELMYAI
jgi:V/A-type H+-transporting ATPase subunit C